MYRGNICKRWQLLFLLYMDAAPLSFAVYLRHVSSLASDCNDCFFRIPASCCSISHIKKSLFDTLFENWLFVFVVVASDYCLWIRFSSDPWTSSSSLNPIIISFELPFSVVAGLISETNADLEAESIHVYRSITLIFHHNLDGLDYDYPAGEDQLLARIAGRAARSLRKVRLFG